MPDSLKQRFAGVPVLVYGLAVTSFINRMGGTAKLFMALYLRETLGFDLAAVGMLLALYGAGLLAGSFGVSVLTDHLPARRLMLGMLVASAACLLMLCWVSSPLWLAVWLLLGGVFDGGYRPSMQRVLMQSCPQAIRSRAQSLQRVAVNLGFAFGGLIGGWFAEYDYRYVFAADAATALAAATFLHWALRRADTLEPPQVHASGTADNARWPYADPPFLWFLLACLLLSIVYAQSESTMSNYLREYAALSPAWIGATFALNGFMVAFLQIPVTLHTEHWPPRRTMMLGAAVLTGGFAILPLAAGLPAPGGALVALLSTAIYTLGEMLLMPPQTAMMMQRADTGRAGHYLALYNAIWGGRTMLAPLLGNLVYARFGGHAVWAMCAGFGALALWVQYHAISRMQAVTDAGR
ncbi:MFS transporter [Chitinimonas sp. BJYL2]|uniref:MFS transporter n=1 Tax=Chitinimonas sp. BJYL2 TaxID=2976696 RepID=UPI0022B4CA5A|nr:MFS transporter [Chitinimonas sp. BJYL2]